MPLTGGPLVGRDKWLGELGTALTATVTGNGGCVVVEGPAGIGKSRLLAVVAEEATRRGLPVAVARPTELDRIAPLSALLRALRAASPPVLDDATIAELARQEGNRFWLLDRLGETIEEFAAERGLVMILDDTQWADELTALALRTFVPTMRNSPVLWLMARRPQSTKSPVRDAVDWLLSEGATHIRLEPLSEQDVATFCGQVLGAVPGSTVLSLAERSGGNPFLLEQLLTTMVADGRVVVEDDTATVVAGDLPTMFLNAVEHRLRDLSPGARRLLDVASVIGRPFTLHEAAGLAGIPAVQLLAAADVAAKAGILVDSGTELEFGHDILREAVYQALSGPVRHVLHREAAFVLQSEGRPATEVAEHLVRSARRGDQRAVSVLREAANTIAPRAPDTAADLLLRALDLIDEDDPQHARVVADAVRLLASVGRLGEARELGDAALRHGLDAETEAAILLGLAEALKHAGEDAAVVESTSRALARPGVPDAARAHLLAIRAHALLYVDDHDAAERASVQSISVGTAAGEPAAAVFGLAARSVVARTQGRLADAVQFAREGVQLADTAGGEARGRHPSLWLARALVATDRFTEADAMFELGEREAGQLGTAWSQPLWHFYRAELRLAAGRLDEAEAEAEAGLSVTERLSARALAVPLFGIAAELALRRDDLPTANAQIGRARELLNNGVGAMTEDLGWAVALVHEAGRDLKSALEVLGPIYEALPHRLLLISQEPWAGPQLVRLALAGGLDEWARAAAAATRRLADANPRVASLGGAAAHAEGLLRADRSALHRAVAAYRSSPRVLARASAMEDAARAEKTHGRRTEAVALLDEVLEVYGRCEALRDHARVRRELRALGVRRRTMAPPAAATTGWTSLTEAELRVVRLVAQGMSNRATAARLFLSPHTVDTHLRHAFAKLGVSSRVELTRRVLEHEGTSS
ncbi:regulatory LuxR family protein [Micromonospora pisi]|uniref:Regulatory LuxR family protein n=1 Tax=Micromonospora pisi TaxID=589240 RepID=A0A495JPU6_9ACTN|nr:LuxR family transcriptional regulator [Micromonospora pisi]RKR90392.1 regulatory LuxR family protein [Micromonospora pisi]